MGTLPDHQPNSPSGLKEGLLLLSRGQALDRDQAVRAFEAIMSDSATPAQIGAFLGMIQLRGPSCDELLGGARVMRDKAQRVETPPGLTVIDTCGTGGDHSGTFNISTAAAIVAAGAARGQNLAVAKHGNRSITSGSGSSQVLETLGVKLQVGPATLTRCLDEAGICFCFAPAHHPAMKRVAPIRQELGFRTIFNLLGPLTNPAGAKRQLIGVFDPTLTELYAQVLGGLGSTHAMVVHGRMVDAAGDPDTVLADSFETASRAKPGPFAGGGVDELTPMGPCKVTRLDHGTIQTHWLDPGSLGLARADLSALRVSGPEESAAVIRAVLEGQSGPAGDTVCLNAAAALMVGGVALSWEQGLELARSAIQRGQAASALNTLIKITQADPTAG